MTSLVEAIDGLALQLSVTLVVRHGAQRLVFLGDFLHAAHAQQARVMEPLSRWRTKHADVECVLVRGNHDSHAGDPPASLRITVVGEPWAVNSGSVFSACHHPQELEGRMVLAGHWHPVVTLRGRVHDHQRLACFCRMEGVMGMALT